MELRKVMTEIKGKVEAKDWDNKGMEYFASVFMGDSELVEYLI